MRIKLKMKKFPFRTISFLFVIWNNSKFALHKSTAFSCYDESIKKPFSGDSITFQALFGVLLTVHALFVYLTEHLLHSETAARPKSVHQTILNYYYSGFLYVLAFTEVMKALFTELRPHFYYTCLPDVSESDCSKGLITEYQCTGNVTHWLERDIYRSFPSGHASMSFYGFIFIAVYVYFSRDGIRNYIRLCWCRIVTVLPLIFAIVVCISRIADNRHFWWDVMTGVIIGVIGGFMTVLMFLKRSGQANQAPS